MKIKWKVSSAPTGRYRSFESRAWPSAYYKDEQESPAAMILCEDEYTPSRVKTGDHKSLTVSIADHSVKPWQWRKCKKEVATLEEAKQLVVVLLEKYSHFVPG